MFRTAVLALAALGGASAKVVDLTNGYTFEQFLVDFGKTYDAKELPMREKIFQENLKRIVAHNARGATWTEAVNKFTDMAADEVPKGLNQAMLFQQKTSGKSSAKVAETTLLPRDLPTSVDWRDKGVVTPIKDQGHCGSCWTFAATECLESKVAIDTGLLFTLSEQEFVSCVENPEQCGGTGGCEGATMELAYEYAMANGLVTEWTTPYTSYNGDDGKCPLTDLTPLRSATISGYEVTKSNDYDSLMQAVATTGPVSITVDASKWSTYEGGVFDGCNQETPELDHGVLLVGYGTDPAAGDYWLVRNSWGPNWGEAGYIRLARVANEGDRCGVDVTPADGVGCAGGPSNITVCGTCGLLYDASYPTGAALV